MHWLHGGTEVSAVVCSCSIGIFSACETGKPSGRTIANEDQTMKNYIAAYRANAAKRALYRRTRDEIASLPRSIALDLGIFPEDADRLARESVWG
jgi:hypothetical protein